MNKKSALFCLLSFFYSSAFSMVCSDFGDFKQYGSHYYAITGSKYTFSQAKQIAENNGGYLAIPNDAGENSFLATTFGMAWIGVYDPNQSQSGLCYTGNVCTANPSRFVTVKGTAISYSNWASGEPNNVVEDNDIVNGTQMVAPLGEHWIVIGQNGQWGTFGNHAQELNNPVQFKAVFEFDAKPECVVGGPTSDTLLERECTDAIINTGSSSSGSVTTDSSGDPAITTGNTYKCQSDTYGNEFCPAQLAPCDTVWGYQDGYSVSYQICGDGSQPVNGLCKTTTKACDAVGGTWNGTNCTVGSNYAATGVQTLKQCRGAIYNGVSGGIMWFVTNITIPVNSSISYAGDTVDCDSNGGITYHWLYNTYIPIGSSKTYFDQGAESEAGTLSNITDSSDYATTYTCPSGGTLSGTTCINTTTVAASCSNVSPDGYCYSAPMTYYKYLCSPSTNEYGESYTPTVTSGTSSAPPPNNCKIESFSCVPATDRKCAYVSGGWKCSPFPCYGESNLESADTTVGATDSASKGFNNDGSCSGQIRLFNGKDMRCRSWDILFGLLGGGCCQRDNGSGLGALFGGQCKEDERLLAKYRKETMDKSRYIGEYCSKYLKLGFAKICVQKKKTYCVFNSKLARIIHEQGRPQIGIDWGGAKAPNCKGFTPEEFQKIDFSKLDLSEFYGDLQSKIQTTIDAKVGTTIQQKVQSFGVNITGGSQ